MSKFYPEVHQELLGQLKQLSMERFKSRLQPPVPESAPEPEEQTPAPDSPSHEDMALLEEHYDEIK